MLLGKRNAVDSNTSAERSSLVNLGDENVENARELLIRVKIRIDNRYGYIKLFSLLAFFGIYLTSLSVQKNVIEAFSVESSIIMSDIMASLPANGQGGFFNAGGPGATGLLTSSDQLIQWLSQTIVPALFQDAICGDGQCDADENSGLGRFGCARDCGRVALSETIKIEILLQTTIQQDYAGEIALRDLDPKFKYNIFSSMRNDYIFEAPMSPSNISTTFETLKQDQLELRLFQTKSLSSSTDPTRLQGSLRALASTIPPRSALTDYHYGDPFELLSLANAGVEALQAYCWNCQARGCFPRVRSDVCTDPFFEPLSAALVLLDSYGVAGSVQYTYIDQETGKAKSRSLLGGGAESVQFCSAMPRRGDLEDSHSANSYQALYVSWLAAIKAAETACESPAPMPAALLNASLRRGEHLRRVGSALRRGWRHRDPISALRRATTPKVRALGPTSPCRAGDNGRADPEANCADAALQGAGDAISTEPGRSVNLGVVQRRRAAKLRSKSAVANAAPPEPSKTSGLSGLLAVQAENPIGLTLNVVGVDDGGGWMCYSMGADHCYLPSVNEFVTWNDSSPDRSEAFGKYRYAGAVYLGVDIADIAGSEVRYSLDGSTPNCHDPVQESQHNCYISKLSDEDFVVRSSREFKYDSKSRVVIYDMSSSSERTDGWNNADVDVANECSNLKAWTCSIAGSTPSDLSVLNITSALQQMKKYEITQNKYDLDKPVGPLEPGPVVNINFLVIPELRNVELDQLRLQLCRAVWNNSDEQERCSWQIWVDIKVGANVEIWSDDDPPWHPYDNGFSTDVWTVSVTVLMESNSNAARARHLLTKVVNSNDFITSFHVQKMKKITVAGDSAALANNNQYFAHVTAPWPVDKRDEMSVYGCTTHYECAGGLFCSYLALKTFDFAQSQDQYVGAGYGCDSCKTCFDSESYAIDGACPPDKCSPRAGTFPKCWDAQKLLANFSCSDKYSLNLSSVQSNNQLKVPTEAPEKTLRARFLTPFNRLVGALVVKQKRLKILDHRSPNGSSQVCSFRNDSFSKYSRTADPSRGLICLDKEGQDAGFFGVDPVFAAFSTLYDGKLNPFDFYKKAEFASSVNPYGFFPHSYDGQKGGDKPMAEVFPEISGDFLLFFDEHVTSVRASKMIAYLKDGNFIDEQTSEITIEMNTINARNNILCKTVFTFTWQPGGKIQWDYSIFSVPIYLYDSGTKDKQSVLEYVCIIFLAINMLSELYDLLRAVKRFNIFKYLLSPANWLDWCHFVIMSIAWWLWYQQVNLTSQFKVDTGYTVLASPADETQARFFMTDSKEEAKFLAFSKSLYDLGQNLRTYTNMTSICVILFVLRMLKALDFQPRMALVTRTISSAFADLFHFLVLFSIIFIGYAFAGNQLFGHQFEGLSGLDNACQFLILILLSFDPTQMWVQMEHASSSKPIFLIYLWTWVFLAFFVLLNIFLAILIEGYTSVKNGISQTQGILQEVIGLLGHEIRRVHQFIWGGNFISDDFLAAELSKCLNQTPTTAAHALHDYSSVALGNCMQIRMESGNCIDLSHLRKILLELPAVKFLSQPVALGGELEGGNIPGEKGGVGGQEISYLDIALMDLMDRYGELNNRLIGKVDNAQNSTSQGVLDDLDDLSPVIQLSVLLERARGIRSMDIGRGADVFCAAFVDRGDDQFMPSDKTSCLNGGNISSGRDQGGRLFQTDILRGTSEVDWTWNQEFRWTLKSFQTASHGSVIDKRQLVIMVYDKDQFSRDDVIGCVMIPFSKLAVTSTIDSWLPIVRPMTSLRWSAWNALQTRLLGQQPQAELKLRITVLKIDSDIAVANLSPDVGGWYHDGPSGLAEATTLKISAKLVNDVSEHAVDSDCKPEAVDCVEN